MKKNSDIINKEFDENNNNENENNEINNNEDNNESENNQNNEVQGVIQNEGNNNIQINENPQLHNEAGYFLTYIINSTIIWIDSNIKNNEYIKFIDELKDLGPFRVLPYENVDDAMEIIKYNDDLKKTYIILNPLEYNDFVNKFRQNISYIYTIPKIILFMLKDDKTIKNIKEFEKYLNHPFYTLGGIKNDFEEIKKFLLTPLKKKALKRNDEDRLTFDYIDCLEKLALPLFFKSLIEITPYNKVEEFTNYVYDKYSKDSGQVNELLYFIQNITDIPIELLAKYYAKLYTADSNETPFYIDLNKDLRENKRDKYLPYIKILYEGVKLKSLNLASNKILYRGTLMSNNEINIMNNYLNQKKENLPGTIVFSRSFLSFSKELEVAKKYVDDNVNDNPNLLSKVLLILEKDDNIDYSLATHADIDKLTFYKESEVLFFPFSVFEVKEEPKEITNDKNEKLYEIKLKYLGNYLKEVEKKLNDCKKVIPDSKFKKEIIDFGLIDKNKGNIRIKELIENYRKHKEEINAIPNKEDLSKENCIFSEVIINGININKNIRIINTYEEMLRTNEKERIKANNKYNNENEIKENCEIKINGEIVDFTYFYHFNKEGIYKIQYKFKKNLTKINHIFYDCSYLSNIDLSNLITLNITETIYMFYGCKNLIKINLSSFNTRNIYDMSYMFYGCQSVVDLDLSDFDTKNVYNMEKMFSGCSSLTKINLSNFITQNVKDMNCIFSGCNSLNDLDLSNFDTQNVNDMSYLFCECNSLTDINLSKKFDTRNVNNMIYMFFGCISLKNLDLSNFNTEKVTSMENMFSRCYNIESINLTNFNTQNVINMGNMFKGCQNLKKLDLSHFKTENVIDMKCMFDGCKSLEEIVLSNFNTENVTNMRYMFFECNSLEDLDLSKFNIENVYDISYMFCGCHKLKKLNLSNFDISNANELRYMFFKCNSLLKENIITTNNLTLKIFDLEQKY